MARTYRLELDAGLDDGQFLVDTETREAPVFYNGSAAKLDFGCFRFGEAVDLSVSDEITLRFMAKDDFSTALLTKTIINVPEKFSRSGWETKTDTQFTIFLTSGDILTLGDEPHQDVIMAVTEKTGANETVLGYETVRFLNFVTIPYTPPTSDVAPGGIEVTPGGTGIDIL